MGKRCFKCGEWKPLYDFYGHSQMADGHLNKCICCTKADVVAHRSSHHASVSAYERERARRPERKAAQAQIARRRTDEQKLRRRARLAVSNAIRDGRLTRRPCGMCGSATSQAHHGDYTKPLDVDWLCFRCHREHAHGQRVEPVAGIGPVGG